jgi:hypothetical protein
MSRTRISTTVDADRLARCRAAFGLPDSELMDRALAALLREVIGQQERAALDAHPYEDDPELSWEAPAGPDLAYDGEVPAEVLRLAAERRARYGDDPRTDDG